MAEDNILTAGLDTCRELRNHLMELSEVKKKSVDAAAAMAQSEKAIKAKEKAVNDEINSTIRKRTDEIEASYDDEIEKLKSRSKKVKSEKGKTKSQRVALRIEQETAQLREKDRQLRLECRSVFKRDNVSAIFNTKLYFALFMPRCFTDYVILIFSILFTLLAIPCAEFFLLFPDTWQTYPGFVLLYFICILVVITVYILIGHFTREKHRETYMEVRGLRGDIRANKREIAAMKRKIRRDKDETGYELNEFDDAMKGISTEISEVIEEKKEALKNFETQVKPALTADIRDKNRPELAELRAYLATMTEEQKTAESRSKELGLFITKNYEAYLGKDYLNVETIDRMLVKLENGTAQTIGEALDMTKNDTDSVTDILPEKMPEPEVTEPGSRQEESR